MEVILHGEPSREAMINRLVEAIRASGAIQQSMDEALSFVECGIGYLSAQPECMERSALEDLTRYIVHRHW
jgi:geranylgeranyl pyrophosphate synthase